MDTAHIALTVNGNKDYAEALKNFASCSSQCADTDMLLQRFLDILSATQKVGQYLVIRIDELNPDSRLIASCGLKNSQYRQVIEQVDSWNQPPENLHQKLDTAQEIFARQLGIHVVSFINSDREGNQTVIFIGCINHSLHFNENDIKFINTLINILELSLQNLNLKQNSYPKIQRIIDAKQQWESTVDVLDVLICLLDQQGRVYRVNKTLEKWKLGSVRCVKEADVHDLLHPHCHDPKCTFKWNWLSLWNSTSHTRVETREFFDHIKQCDLRMTLLRGRNVYNDSQNTDFTTLVIEDTSENRWALKMLEEHSQELYSQIQNQTIEIDKINTNLQNKIHEHKHVRQSLQLTEKKLKSLSSKLLTTQEEERKRIAAELHDGVSQSISAIKFNLESLLTAKWSSDQELPNKHHLETIISRLRDTVEEIRRISMGLRPSMIDELGLLITIQWLCRVFKNDFPALDLEQELRLNEEKISELQKVSIFRIAQEALNNIAKYSHASQVSVKLTNTEKTINLQVEDNGIGFQPDVSQMSSGFGLCSMKERAKLSGGSLSIHSSPGNGTLIKAVWS